MIAIIHALDRSKMWSSANLNNSIYWVMIWTPWLKTTFNQVQINIFSFSLIFYFFLHYEIILYLRLKGAFWWTEGIFIMFSFGFEGAYGVPRSLVGNPKIYLYVHKLDSFRKNYKFGLFRRFGPTKIIKISGLRYII